MQAHSKKFMALVLALLAGAGIYVQAQTKSFVWDSNTEADMREYVLVLCPGTPCAIGAAGAQLTVVPHVAGQPTHASPVPNGVSGYAAVYARDTSGNLSPRSNEVAFDGQAPVGPRNLRIQ